MKFLFNNSGFTFIELVVSMLISSIILTEVFYFISQNIEEITYSTNRTTFYNDFYNFRDKLIYYSNIYNSGIILVNNSNSIGSDVLLLQNSLGTDGILFGVVDENNMKIEKKITAYNVYYNKSLGFKRVGASEITAMKTNSGYIYTVLFYKDKLYKRLKMKDLQMDMYNSGSILNIDLTLIERYNPDYLGSTWNILKGQKFIKFNLNF